MLFFVLSHRNLELLAFLELRHLTKTSKEVFKLLLCAVRLLEVIPSLLVFTLEILRVGVINSHELNLGYTQSVQVVV